MINIYELNQLIIQHFNDPKSLNELSDEDSDLSKLVDLDMFTKALDGIPTLGLQAMQYYATGSSAILEQFKQAFGRDANRYYQRALVDALVAFKSNMEALI